MAIEKIYNDPKGRRNSERIPFKGQVDLVLKDNLYKEMSANISETGIFLKSRQPDKYKVLDKCTLSFQKPDLYPVKRTGIIIRKTDNGIGVVYLGIDYPSEFREPTILGGLSKSYHSA